MGQKIQKSRQPLKYTNKSQYSIRLIKTIKTLHNKIKNDKTLKKQKKFNILNFKEILGINSRQMLSTGMISQRYNKIFYLQKKYLYLALFLLQDLKQVLQINLQIQSCIISELPENKMSLFNILIKIKILLINNSYLQAQIQMEEQKVKTESQNSSHKENQMPINISYNYCDNIAQASINFDSLKKSHQLVKLEEVISNDNQNIKQQNHSSLKGSNRKQKRRKVYKSDTLQDEVDQKGGIENNNSRQKLKGARHWKAANPISKRKYLKITQQSDIFDQEELKNNKYADDCKLWKELMNKYILETKMNKRKIQHGKERKKVLHKGDSSVMKLIGKLSKFPPLKAIVLPTLANLPRDIPKIQMMQKQILEDNKLDEIGVKQEEDINDKNFKETFGTIDAKSSGQYLIKQQA